jgi:Spy/CpxP family protein refolding chaperone
MKLKAILIAFAVIASLSSALAQDSADSAAHPRFRKLAKALDLSAKQVAQLRGIRVAAKEQIASVRASSKDKRTMRANIRDIRTHKRAQMLAVLTPEQRAKLEAMRFRHKKSR